MRHTILVIAAALFFQTVNGQQTQPSAKIGTPNAVVETQLEGEFHGWDGDTVFKMANGQIWQQSSYAYTYHYVYRPDVLIYPSAGGYKMKVEGVDDTISVRRLK